VFQKFASLLLRDNVTAYQVSKETGIATSTFSDWKSGRSQPKLDKLLILAKYFNVSIEYFLEEEKVG